MSDWRFEHDLKMRPVMDKLYAKVFGDGVGIDRHEHEDDHLLDRRFAIDVELRLPNDQILLGQEKCLTYRYRTFGTLTVEYYQNQWTEERGDWFKLAAQIYFCGYSGDDADSYFDPWCIVNWPRLVILTNEHKIDWKHNANRNGRARASFIYTRMVDLPRDCIIASSFTDGLNLNNLLIQQEMEI